MDGETVRPALKILATQLTEAQAVEGGFQLRSLPVFDRVWVQGTVRQKLLGAVQLDDGTGSVHCVVGAARDKPGLEINSVSPSDYCLVIGKLVGQQGGRQLTIKVHKLLNLSQECQGQAPSRRMMHWSAEVAELHRLLEAAAEEGA